MTQTLIPQQFGKFLEQIPDSEEYLTLNFSPTAAARNRRWNNYGLSADFLGDYFATFFPGDETEEQKISQRETVKASVSYIANELIENAVKYSESSVSLPISISLHLYEHAIIFQVINYANQISVKKYQAFIEQVLDSNLDEFYMQQLEATALGAGGSNMGLLTMMNDYSAQFGWKFQTIDSHLDLVRVSVMVHLNL